MNEIIIRTASMSDASAIANLSNRLGYPVIKEDTEKYLRLLKSSKKDIVYVAVSDNEVIGWMHIFKTVRVESGIFCEIGGLVIDEEFRGKGIGKRMIEKARIWCKENGSDKLRVRSNVKREAAKNFYFHEGFRQKKVQNVFECAVKDRNHLQNSEK